jgi:hypothetical protein
MIPRGTPIALTTMITRASRRCPKLECMELELLWEEGRVEVCGYFFGGTFFMRFFSWL